MKLSTLSKKLFVITTCPSNILISDGCENFIEKYEIQSFSMSATLWRMIATKISMIARIMTSLAVHGVSIRHSLL